jgi:hypothetical protein
VRVDIAAGVLGKAQREEAEQVLGVVVAGAAYRERRRALTWAHASTSSGHGTIVDFTVFMAMASATACDTPSSVKG